MSSLNFLKADNTPPLTVMGLMSGTSMDGVDACLAKIQWRNGKLDYEILATHSQQMPDDLKQRLLTAMSEKMIHLETFCALNVAVGELFAETALGLIQTSGISAESIDCIASHGQTLYHWPPPRDSVTTIHSPTTPDMKINNTLQHCGTGQLGGTLQIGEPSIIAEKTGIYTIADFRPRDMAAGGQGAPLVCFADVLLFQDEAIGRCVQNVGGIANVTVIPAQSPQTVTTSVIAPVIAFDTGPGNMLMDAAMRHFFGKPFDQNGDMAATGHLDNVLLSHLMAHPYLQLSPPKTTGRELFGEPCFQVLLQEFPDITGANWLATLTQYTAQSIVDAYQQFVFPTYDIHEMVIGGGGAYNLTLLNALKHLFQGVNQSITLKTHADFGIPDQYKEALAFAILGWASYLKIPNNVPSCTGALHPVILGKHIFPDKSINKNPQIESSIDRKNGHQDCLNRSNIIGESF